MTVDRPWHILTGEYPPQAGGVADYTGQVAARLAAAGDAVHVWAPPFEGSRSGVGGDGVVLHRDAGRWSRDHLARIGRELDASPGPRRLLVQYTPFSWGFRGMNVAFPRWLKHRRRLGDDVWTMVHEAAYPFRRNEGPAHWFLAATNRWMLRGLAAASSRIYHGMGPHAPLLRRYAVGLNVPPLTWLPVPSNVPVVNDPVATASVRERVAPNGEPVIGHFGTFGWSNDTALRSILPRLLAGRTDRVALLLGRNGDDFAAETVAAHPGLAGRVVATGGLPPAELSAHLLACDVLVQPYMDGVSTRRGTLMAGLAHGRPIVTNLGRSSDPVFAESGCVKALPNDDVGGMALAVEALLGDPAERAVLTTRALEVYDRRFSVERTVETLRNDALAASNGRIPAGTGSR